MSPAAPASRATPLGEDEQVVRDLFRRLRSPDGLRDPYRIYGELREREASGASIGRVIVRHDQATEVLSDRSVSSERIEALVSRLEPEVREDIAEVTETLSAIVAFRDPPGHTRVRRLLAQALRARAVSRQREVIERAANRLLDDLLTGRRADIHAAFTYPLPAMVVAGILGIPEADRRRFERWANDIVFFVGSGDLDEHLARATLTSVREMRAYLTDLVAARRADPRDDLLTAMIEAEDDGTLSDVEIHANALFLMTAGHETATNMLSNGILTLLRHPEQLALLREQPDLVDAATEEILRFESPVQMTPRLAKEDTVLAGREVAAGDPVVIVLGAANRDPEAFRDPDEFRLDRTDGKHVAFAHGAHWCIGGPLAREEARIVLPLVLERLPELRLAQQEIDWQPTLNFRGPTRLEVAWR
ncbi:cytochrome P450 [Nitriliruptor alkaliphilus]|uniref:cytochrome P450 n=1 Tax=Nitriliruptor alkaliphilus TaxID=427918 RepID=UPI000697E4B0|nr:cytochrome P450 [Nitriliruptor alkaliphilus]